MPAEEGGPLVSSNDLEQWIKAKQTPPKSGKRPRIIALLAERYPTGVLLGDAAENEAHVVVKLGNVLDKLGKLFSFFGGLNALHFVDDDYRSSATSRGDVANNIKRLV
jgi:hypothetical protein